MVSIKVKSRPSRTNGTSFFAFMQEVISKLKQQGKTRTSETYLTTLNSFMRFRRGKDLSLDEVDANLMVTYETWLRSKNISMNTISFYMRILRATYNRAVEKGQILQQYPFKPVYTGIEKTAKRAIPLCAIQQIKALDLTSDPPRRYARDMFLLCFYIRGMSLIDMAFLKKRDITNGILSYRRKKRGNNSLSNGKHACKRLSTNTTFRTPPIYSPLSVNREPTRENNTSMSRIESIGISKTSEKSWVSPYL